MENAQVCLIVADEAVLTLAGYSLRDPLTYFSTNYSNNTSSINSRDLIRYASLQKLKELFPSSFDNNNNNNNNNDNESGNDDNNDSNENNNNNNEVLNYEDGSFGGGIVSI